MTKAFVAATVFVIGVGGANAKDLPIKGCYTVEVPPLSVAEAINSLASQTGTKLLFPYDLTQSYQARPVIGCYTLQEAMDIMLYGSGLTSGLSKNGLFVISLKKSDKPDRKDSYKRKDRMINKKRNILATAIGILIGTADVSETFAQDQDPALIEEIYVSGIRYTQRKNLELKRMSDAVVDVITAEDVGKFPDKNVADSLQRVPGIVIDRDGGEGSRVSIRGLSSDLTLSQLNGNTIASSPGTPSRSFNYLLLPSSMIKSVEVYKSSEARIDEGGVGGTVILHSRTPFDMDAGEGTFDVEYTNSDVTEKFEPSYTGVYSWKNEDETLGFLVGASHQKRTNRELEGNLSSWNYLSSDADVRASRIAPDANGNPISGVRTKNAITDASGVTYDGVWMPDKAWSVVNNEERVRDGLQLTTQWRPTDSVELTANYFGFRLNRTNEVSRLSVTNWRNRPDHLVGVDVVDGIVAGANYRVDASGTEKDMIFPWMKGSYEKEEETSDTFDFSATYEGERLSAKITAGYTKATGGPEEKWDLAYYSSNHRSRADGDPIENASQYAGWSIKGDRLNTEIDPDTLENLLSGVGGGVDPGSSNSGFDRSTLEESYFQADFNYNLDWAAVTTLRSGFKLRKAKARRDRVDTYYLDPSFDIQAALDSGYDITRFDAYQWNDGMPPIKDYLETKGLGNIAGGFDINLFPAVNMEAYRNYVRSNYVRYDDISDTQGYSLEEDISAMYVQADFEWKAIRGNLGVRAVQTDRAATSVDTYIYNLDYYVDGDYTSGDDRSRTVREELSRENTFTDILPSFNIVWDAGENLVIRGAIAKVISRPAYGDLASREGFTHISDEWAADRAELEAVAGWTGSGGNKNLLDFEAIQYDASAEYYYGESSAVGIALFYKDIANFVVPVTTAVSAESPGLPGIYDPETVHVPYYSTKANASDGASQGLELFVQHAFDNGFGISANYTYNDTNQATVSLDGVKIGEVPLIGSAKYQGNFSAYYENDKFSVRTSYNLRGERVLRLDNGINDFADEYDQVDVNASYRITENLVATASIVNLTKSEPVIRRGNDTDARLASRVYTGRRMYAGISYKF